MSSFQGKKVLVTGGAGQIGSHLVAALVQAGAEVSVADNLWRGKKSNLDLQAFLSQQIQQRQSNQARYRSQQLLDDEAHL